MKSGSICLTVAVAAALAGCVTVPVGPAVPAVPGPAKSAAQFGVDDAECRNFAQAAVAGPAQAANDNAASAAAAATVFGAITGALFGAAVGDAGAGAAIGAGTGLLWGGAAAAPGYGYASYDLQRTYDALYVRCMASRGNIVPGRTTYRVVQYPPPNTPPPPGVTPGVRGTIVPAPVNPPPYTSPAGTPPPGTPAPTL